LPNIIVPTERKIHR